MTELGGSTANELFSRKSDELARLFIETAPDAVIIIDSTSRILMFSPAAERLFGYSSEEVVGKSVSILMPSPYAEDHGKYIQKYLQTGKSKIIGIGREVVAKKKNGEVFPIELAVGEMIADGVHVFTGFVRDISVRREYENRVAELQSELFHVARFSALGELTITLAHELNQPLTAISNYATAAGRLCKQGEEGVSKATGLMELIAAQATRAGQIIRKVRNFIMRREVERAWDNVLEATEEAVQIASIGAARRNITIEVHCHDKDVRILMDRVQIQQVITNIVRNAVDALSEWPDERHIDINIGESGDGHVEIEVVDTGPGIAPEVCGRLFEPFQSTKSGGIGIGLAVSKRIVEAHGGTVEAFNNSGSGATFRIRLPIAGNAERAA